MNLVVESDWSGWDGETVVELSDGSVWRQDEYYYEYRYAYRPKATVEKGAMMVDGMRRAVRVQRVN